MEKGLRTCVVATGLADDLELVPGERRAVYHAALLMGLGCTAHAPENAAMFEDDRAFAAAFRELDLADPGRGTRVVRRVGGAGARTGAGGAIRGRGRVCGPGRRARLV